MSEQLDTENNQFAGLKAEAASLEETPVSKAEAEAAAEMAKTEADSAKATAHGSMAVITMVLKTLMPYLEIDPKQSAEVADAVAPVLEKYGLHLGGMWDKELTAITAIGTFGFVVYSQVKTHQEEAEAKKKALNNGQK